jgi:hypothetical protein
VRAGLIVGEPHDEANYNGNEMIAVGLPPPWGLLSTFARIRFEGRDLRRIRALKAAQRTFAPLLSVAILIVRGRSD